MQLRKDNREKNLAVMDSEKVGRYINERIVSASLCPKRCLVGHTDYFSVTHSSMEGPTCMVKSSRCGVRLRIDCDSLCAVCASFTEVILVL